MEEKIHQKDVVVFYHADCTDGFTAAWVAWKKFGDKAEYIAYNHENNVPEIKDKEIYTVDMTFPKEITERLMRDNKRLTSIDHHISNKEITLMTQEGLFDNNHSGCILAWKYFFPNETAPMFLEYIEDYDIWIHKYKSKALYQYLNLFDRDFKTWSQLVTDFDDEAKRKIMIEKGELLFQFEDKIIDYNIDQNAHLVSFEGYTVYSINSDRTPSQNALKLIKKKPPFAIVWQERKDGWLHVHLRGVGNIDVSEIAKKYGGGGHKLAAAFRLRSLKEIPWQNVD